MDISSLVFLLMLKPMISAIGSSNCTEYLSVDTFREQSPTLKDGRNLRLSYVRPADASELVAFIQRAGDESDFLTFTGSEFNRPVEHQISHIKFSQLNGDLMIKGVIDESIVALLTVHRHVDRPQLSHVASLSIIVGRAHWRLGIAKHLMRASMDWARSKGIRKIDLTVIEDNLPAIRLYTSLGFVIEGISKDGIFVKGRYKDVLSMSLSLEPPN